MSDDVVRASTPLAGGVGESHELCGAILGGVLAVGLRHGRVDRAVPRQPATERAADLVACFHERFGTVLCRDLVAAFPEMTHPARKEHCARLVGFVTSWLRDTLGQVPPA